MIKGYAIKLNGVSIPNVQEVQVRIETPGDARGIYREPTFAATINVVRDASNNAVVDAFGMATNEDGRKNILTSGTIECHGDDVKDNYAFEIKKAFISRWSFKQSNITGIPDTRVIRVKSW